MTAIAPAVNEFLNLPETGPLTDDQRALFDAVAALPPLRPETPRDGMKRYRLPHPVTGETKSTTRATTFAAALETGHMLEAWSMRQTAVGVAGNAELAERITTAAAELERAEEVGDRDVIAAAKRVLNGLAERAKTLSGADTNREVGTALHAVAERLDHGISVMVPEIYAADLQARADALAAAGLARPAAYRERIVTLPDLGVTGTTDGIAVDEAGQLYIFDDKFGASMAYSWAKTLVQLALYSRAPWIWDHETSAWAPMPAVSQDTAYICHTPAGTGTSTVYRLDINEGWELAQECATVRAAQSRAGTITRKAAKGEEYVIPVAHSGDTVTKLEETVAQASVPEASVDLFDAAPTPAETDSAAVSATHAGASDGSAAVAPGQDGAATAAPSVNAGAAPLTDADGLTGPVGQGEAGTTCPASPEDADTWGPAPMDDAATRSAWIVSRLKNIKASGDEVAYKAVSVYWPEGCPPPGAVWDDDQIAALDALLVAIERQDGVGFPERDPEVTAADASAVDIAPPPVTLLTRPIADDMARPSEDDIAALTAAVTAVLADPVRKQVTKTWMEQGKTHGRRWSHGPDDMTRRLHAIQSAVTACTASLLDEGDTDDSLVRAAIEEATGEDLTAPTGAALGSLTYDEATRLHELAESYGAGDDETVKALASRLTRQFARLAEAS